MSTRIAIICSGKGAILLGFFAQKWKKSKISGFLKFFRIFAFFMFALLVVVL